MNRKTIAYFAVAVMLGFTIMTLPLAMQTPLTKPGENNFSGDTRNQETDSKYALPSAGKDGPPTPGLATQPSNLLPSSGILLAGLVVAAAVYLIVKRRLA